MAKRNGKIKIQEERKKRQQQLTQIETIIAQRNQQIDRHKTKLSELYIARLKLQGSLEMLDELEGIKPTAPSDNGAPAEEKELEKES